MQRELSYKGESKRDALSILLRYERLAEEICCQRDFVDETMDTSWEAGTNQKRRTHSGRTDHLEILGVKDQLCFNSSLSISWSVP